MENKTKSAGDQVMKDLSQSSQKNKQNSKRKLQARMQPDATLILEKPTSEKALIITLRDQLNFYLGDSNLSKDKFLQEQLQKGTQISLETFMSFNRIKSLFGGVADEYQKMSLIQQAVTQSRMLKLSKCKTKVKRRVPFKKADINKQKMDDCTVYVENFPKLLTLDQLSQIFKRAGPIQHVSIPKFKGESAENKGFAFIEFSNDKAAKEAVTVFNNCIPEEFTSMLNFVGNLTQLRVMSKERWNQYKEEARQIKREIAALSPNAFSADKENKPQDWKAKTNGFEHGTLLKVTGLQCDKTSKKKVDEYFCQFGKPCFVDFKENSTEATLRFSSTSEANDFNDKMSVGLLKGTKLTLLTKPQTTAYYKQALAARMSYQKYFGDLRKKRNVKADRKELNKKMADANLKTNAKKPTKAAKK